MGDVPSRGPAFRLTVAVRLMTTIPDRTEMMPNSWQFLSGSLPATSHLAGLTARSGDETCKTPMITVS
jgi:hypothetical protein